MSSLFGMIWQFILNLPYYMIFIWYTIFIWYEVHQGMSQGMKWLQIWIKPGYEVSRDIKWLQVWSDSKLNPYPWILEKKSKTRDRHRARLAGKNSERSIASFVCVPMLWNFFPASALGDGPRKWHIFLFSAAYFRTYWHMPFGIGIIR